MELDISSYYLDLLKNNEIDLVIDHSVEGWYYINWQLVFDVFQIVPSQRFCMPFKLPAFSFYRTLRRLNNATVAPGTSSRGSQSHSYTA
jgi:hypothetical protein